MNEGRLGKKVRQDADKFQTDVSNLAEDGISQLSQGVENLVDNAKETVINAATTVRKDVGHGLDQYNTKAQEFVDKVPGGLGEKAAEYPWVAISIALAVGFLLGGLLNPTQKHLG